MPINYTPPSLSELLAAYKNNSAADAVNALSKGVTDGMTLAGNREKAVLDQQNEVQKLANTKTIADSEMLNAQTGQQNLGLTQKRIDQDAQNYIPAAGINALAGKYGFPALAAEGTNVPYQMADTLEHFGQLKDQKSARSQAKLDADDEKAFTLMGKDLDPNAFRSGALGENQKRLNSSERVLTLLDQTKMNPNAVQTPEAAQAVAALIGSGTGVVSQQQIEHLMPKSYKGDFQRFLGALTNQPLGLEQQAFIKSYLDTADRERATIQTQMAQAQLKKLTRYNGLRQRHPDLFDQNARMQIGDSYDAWKQSGKLPGIETPFLDSSRSNRSAPQSVLGGRPPLDSFHK